MEVSNRQRTIPESVQWARRRFRVEGISDALLCDWLSLSIEVPGFITGDLDRLPFAEMVRFAKLLPRHCNLGALLSRRGLNGLQVPLL
jgi:hypothetical protein